MKLLAKTQSRKGGYIKEEITENDIATIIVNKANNIHVQLGSGLLESVYEEIFYYELVKEGLYVERQNPIPLLWEGLKMNIGYRADLIVESKVIIEIKSVVTIAPVHPKQVLTYLEIADKRLGLLINFNEKLIKNAITRIVNNLGE